MRALVLAAVMAAGLAGQAVAQEGDIAGRALAIMEIKAHEHDIGAQYFVHDFPDKIAGLHPRELGRERLNNGQIHSPGGEAGQLFFQRSHERRAPFGGDDGKGMGIERENRTPTAAFGRGFPDLPADMAVC